MSWGQQWAPYVSVGEKLNMAVRHAIQLAKKQKREREPVKLEGRKIANTFWGKAWCDNLTAYQDYSNRLPRGATYLRNGSVVDLIIKPKMIEAIVAGSEPYVIRIEISELDKNRWKAIRSDCSESIDSLLDLLSGKLSDGVMQRLTDQTTGLFPSPREIRMSCSCPDYSSCCKHLAAVMYGVGARLDNCPELLFMLRGVNQEELVTQAIAAGNLDRELNSGSGGLDSQDLGAIFGIELEGTESKSSKPVKKKRTATKTAAASASVSTVAVVPKKRKKADSGKNNAKSKESKEFAEALAKKILASSARKAATASTTAQTKKVNLPTMAEKPSLEKPDTAKAASNKSGANAAIKSTKKKSGAAKTGASRSGRS